MKIENLFCSRDQAVRLKELGINQAGNFFVHRDSKSQTIFFQAPEAGKNGWINMTTGYKEENEYLHRVMVRVFSVAELGFIITSDIFTQKADGTAWPEWFNKKWDYDDKSFQVFNPIMLADMIIYLLEQKIMSAAEINKQLLQ